MVSAIRSANASRAVQRREAGHLGDPLAAGTGPCSGARTARGPRSPAPRRRRRTRPASPAARRRPAPARRTTSCRSARRASVSPARARSGSRSSAATGRGAPGQAGAARKPASAARADSVAWSSDGTAGPDHDRPVAEARRAAAPRSRQRIGRAADHHHQPVAVHPADHLDPSPPGGPVDGVQHRGDVAARGAADHHRHRRRVRPAQRGGPAGQHVRGVAAQQRVDQQRLQPGVPGAARLGGPGVHPGGGERDLPGELAGSPRAAPPPRRPRPGAATCSSATSMVTLISATVWVRVIDRASARGAAANTSSEISCGARRDRPAASAATRPATGRRPGRPA